MPSSFSRLRLALILFGLVPVLPAQDANRPPAAASAAQVGDEPLVIANGKLSRDGQTVPATMGNVLELVRARFPGNNIILTGGEDIMIENLRLIWKRVRDLPHEPLRDPSVLGVLRALSAASGGKFDSQQFGPLDFVVQANGGHVDTTPQTEIFNLSSFFYRGPPRAHLEGQLAELKLRRAALEKRVGDKVQKGDEVKSAYVQEVGQIDIQLEIAQKQLAENRRPSEEAVKVLVAQIQEVARMTLARLRPGEKLPEFQFHPGSNLLIVIGSPTSVDVTRKVIAALERNP